MADTRAVEGASELAAKFRGLRDDMQRRTAFRMAVAGARVVVRSAKDIARGLGLMKSGTMVRNIVSKREPNAGAGVAQYNVGVRHGHNLTKKQKSTAKLAVNKNGRIVKKYENDPFYWRFIEFDKKGRSGTPFMAPALEQNPGAPIDAMSAVLDKELAK